MEVNGLSYRDKSNRNCRERMTHLSLSITHVTDACASQTVNEDTGDSKCHTEELPCSYSILFQGPAIRAEYNPESGTQLMEWIDFTSSLCTDVNDTCCMKTMVNMSDCHRVHICLITVNDFYNQPFLECKWCGWLRYSEDLCFGRTSV